MKSVRYPMSRRITRGFSFPLVYSTTATIIYSLLISYTLIYSHLLYSSFHAIIITSNLYSNRQEWNRPSFAARAFAENSQLPQPPTLQHLRKTSSRRGSGGFSFLIMSALLGAGYDSSDDDSVPKTSATTATKIVAAPEVNTEVWSPDFSPSPSPWLEI